VFTAYVEYSNVGSSDVPSPTIYLSSPTSSYFTLDPIEVPTSSESRLVIGTGGARPVGVLRAGETRRLAVRMKANQRDNQLNALLTQAGSTAAVNWERERLRLMAGMTLSDASFTSVFNTMAANTGTTAGQYVQMLARNASLLPPELGDSRDPAAAMRLELARTRAAMGTSISGALRTDDESVDLSGVRVTAINATTGAAIVTTSLNDGSFVFDSLTAGTYSFAVENLAITSPAPFALADGQSATGVDLVVAASTTLAGNVVSASSVVVPLGSLLFVNSADQAFAAQAETDASGAYMVALEPGTYDVIIDANGGGRTTIANVVITDGSNQRNFTMTEAARVTGRGLLDGLPTGDTGRLLFASARPVGAAASFETVRAVGAVDGTFDLTGLSAGTYTVTLIAGNASEVINNVVVTGGQTLNLGDVALSSPVSQQGVASLTAGATGAGASLAAAGGPSVYSALTNPNNPEALDATDPVILQQIIETEEYVQGFVLKSLTSTFGAQVGALWQDYANGSGANKPGIHTASSGSELVEGAHGLFATTVGFRDSRSKPDLGLQYNAAIKHIQERLDALAEEARQKENDDDESNDQGDFGDSEGGDLGAPCADPPADEDDGDGDGDDDSIEDADDDYLERGFTVRVNEIPFFETNLDTAFDYDVLLEIPGNVAGGGGTQPSPAGNPHGGAWGQEFADTRRLQGFVNVTPEGRGKAKATFFIEMNVFDTMDFLPGNPGTGQEQKITGALTFLESYNHAYDVPVNVTWLLLDEFPSTNLFYTVEPEEEPTPAPKPLNSPSSGDGDGGDDCGPGGGGGTAGVGSRDPNNKETIGVLNPDDVDAIQYVRPGTALPYTVNFENVPTATAPAQEVFVTDVLDDDLDLSTFTLGDVGFGSTTVDVPDGLTYYSTRLDLTTTLGHAVDVEGSLDFTSRTINWTFRSIDPDTGDLVSDPFAGFLPPNDATGRGEGFVTYAVSPYADRGNGTRIENAASIVFDTNAAIVTNTTINVIDDAAPAATVEALPATSAETFTVTWTGDDTGGAGVRTYDVYVSRDGGAFTLWQSATTANSRQAIGQRGSTYAFYAVATDRVGVQEQAQGLAQAQTTIESGAAPGTAQLVADPLNPGKMLLQVEGTSAANRLIIRGRGERARVWIDGVAVGLFNDVARIEMRGGDGDDYIVVSRSLRMSATIYGDSGNDRITGGSGPDLLYGGNGDDILRASAGADILFGGDGNDTLFGGRADSVLVGGAGNDLLRGARRSRHILIGGEGADTLTGSDRSDLLVAASTAYDDDAEALFSLLATWRSRQLSFAERVNILSDNSLLHLAPDTLVDDIAVDILTGGAAIDWFVANRTEGVLRDVLRDPRTNELETDPSAA
jgi:Ca2+-binding RTX toxin-like protein